MKKILKLFEFKLLVFLVKRYSNNELDQFEHWTVDSKYGTVFVSIDRNKDDEIEYVKVD